MAPSDLHRNPHGRSKAGKAITELLGAIPDAIVRYGYARLAADRLGVPAQLVWQRLGVGKEALTAALAPPAEGATPGRRAEEEALRALLVAADRGSALPDAALLPPPEAFLDPELRKFFDAFRGLYLAGEAPTVRAVLAAAGDPGGAGASGERAAALLLESEDSTVSPAAALLPLRRRWLRERLRELNREISDAERRGDRDRVSELMAEKSAVNGELHRPVERVNGESGT
jgi:DNA primase